MSTPPPVATDLRTVVDPDTALAISRAGLAEQHLMDARVASVVADLERLRRQNHIAQRMENLLGQRRWPR